jgi:hypothetical protein
MDNTQHNSITSSSISKTQKLYIVLCAVFITNALLAEIIGTKIFSLEKIFRLPPAQISFFNTTPLDFNLTTGVLIWPVVFITTDLINEYFGKEGVKRISFITTFLIAYVFVIIWISTLLPPADFWESVNSSDSDGNPFKINAAYTTIFRQGAGIILGSIIAFLVGQMIDTYVFHYLKSISNPRWIWLRATGSTLVSQLIDSYLVLFIAFYLFGGKQQWQLQMVFAVGTINYVYKFFVAILLTPLLYIFHHLIDKKYLKTI